MRISQITGYSNSYQTNTGLKKKNTSFKSYDEAFGEAITKKFTSTVDVSEMYHNLIREAKNFPGARFTDNFYKMPKLDNLGEYIYNIFADAKKVIRNNHIEYMEPLITDAGGKTILCVGMEDGLEFRRPSYGQKAGLTFMVDDENAVKTSYMDDYSCEDYEFYPNRYIGTLKKHFKSSYGTYGSSSTELYNKDGTRKTILGDFWKWLNS